MDAVGTLVSVRIFNQWGVGTLALDDGQRLDLIGSALVGLSEGQRYRMAFRRKVSQRYGEQFEVVTAVPDIQLGAASIERWLVKNYTGCGEKTARRVVEWYEAHASLEALRVLLTEAPWDLSVSPALEAIGKVIAYVEADAGTAESRVYRHLALRLAPYGLPDPVIRRLGAHLAALVGEEENPPAVAWTIFAADPYEPCGRIFGYGFATADLIGLSLGISRQAPCRLAAMVLHVLRTASEKEGHVFLPSGEMRLRFASLAKESSAALFDRALGVMASGRRAVVEDAGRYYLAHLYDAECYVAARLAAMARNEAPPLYGGCAEGLESAIDQAEFIMGDHWRLDGTQREALRCMMTSGRRLHTLTAGPGCGKTALMEILVQVVSYLAIAFAAPTGQAAKVLTSRVGRFGYLARTNHALLEPAPGNGFSFSRNELNPLPIALLVMDETTMADLLVFASTLRALPENAHVILLGDVGQLASVGPGNVLADVLKILADHHRLAVPHRNQGAILKLGQSIQAGRFEIPDSLEIEWAGAPGEASERFDLAATRYLDAVADMGIENVGFLIPRRKGSAAEPGWNVTYANAQLREMINPNGQKITGTTFRVGDRILVRRNLALDQPSESDVPWVEAVVNGEKGAIRVAVLSPKGDLAALVLRLDDEREIYFPAEYLEFLALGYATTVHAAQGSEYQCVVLVIQDGPPGFMNRTILNTGVSRARARLVVFGEKYVLARVAARPAPPRYSALPVRVREYA